MIAIVKQSSIQTGAISEQAVEIDLLRRGYNILEPVVTSRYDLVVETSDRLYIRVQVKTAWLDKHGNLNVSSGKTPYSSAEVDVIAVYDRDNQNVYYVPIDVLDGRTLYSLRLRRYKIKRKKGAALMADRYKHFPHGGIT